MENFLSKLEFGKISDDIGVKSGGFGNLTGYDYSLILMVLLLLVLSYLVNYLLSKSILGRAYQYFLLPGVVLHETAHLIFCILTGAKVVSVTFFDSEGGRVEHEKPKLPIIGQVLISTAPLVFGIIAIFLLASWLGLKGIEIGLLKTAVMGDWLQFFARYLEPVSLSGYKTWLAIYFILAVAVTMAPSKQDFKNIAGTLAVGSLAFLALEFFGTHLDFSYLPIGKLTSVILTTLFLLILSLVFSIIIFAVSKLFNRKN